MKNIGRYIFSGLAIFFIDQITKWFAIIFIETEYLVTPFLSFDITYNRGISWGIGNGQNGLLFYAITIVVILLTVVLGVVAYRRISEQKTIWPEILIISGSVSNIIDRIVHGGVVDFIHFFYKNYSWPLFNVADICIVVGVGLFFLYRFFEEE